MAVDPARRVTRAVVPLLGFALFAFGCDRGGDGPVAAETDDPATTAGGTETPPGAEFYRVTGVVSHQGTPVEKGTITFTPAEGGEAVNAEIAAGKYELRAAPGRYRVEIAADGLPAEATAGPLERVVQPDTTGNLLNLDLPETDRTGGTTPAEVRETFDGDK